MFLLDSKEVVTSPGPERGDAGAALEPWPPARPNSDLWFSVALVHILVGTSHARLTGSEETQRGEEGGKAREAGREDGERGKKEVM